MGEGAISSEEVRKKAADESKRSFLKKAGLALGGLAIFGAGVLVGSKSEKVAEKIGESLEDLEKRDLNPITTEAEKAAKDIQARDARINK